VVQTVGIFFYSSSLKIVTVNIYVLLSCFLLFHLGSYALICEVPVTPEANFHIIKSGKHLAFTMAENK
jgi:hypothetical protein